jgi:hypothetical protein
MGATAPDNALCRRGPGSKVIHNPSARHWRPRASLNGSFTWTCRLPWFWRLVTVE